MKEIEVSDFIGAMEEWLWIKNNFGECKEFNDMLEKYNLEIVNEDHIREKQNLKNTAIEMIKERINKINYMIEEINSQDKIIDNFNAIKNLEDELKFLEGLFK